MFDTIVVATDGSEWAERAVETAVSIGRRLDADVHAIYVIDQREVPTGLNLDPEPMFTAASNAALESATAAGDAQGIEPLTEAVRTMRPVHTAIIDYAEEHSADLIVVGSRGRTGLDRILLGSVAERTIRHSPIPVLTTKEESSGGDFERVLVPTDGSEGALAAAEVGIQFAKTFDAALHVIHAVDVASIGWEGATAQVYNEFEAMGREAVDEVVERASASDLSAVEASVVTGAAGHAIVDYATERDIDVIVIGTHGRGGIDRFLLGSVAEKVARTSPVEVLTVNVRAGESEA